MFLFKTTAWNSTLPVNVAFRSVIQLTFHGAHAKLQLTPECCAETACYRLQALKSVCFALLLLLPVHDRNNHGIYSQSLRYLLDRPPLQRLYENKNNFVKNKRNLQIWISALKGIQVWNVTDKVIVVIGVNSLPGMGNGNLLCFTFIPLLSVSGDALRHFFPDFESRSIHIAMICSFVRKLLTYLFTIAEGRARTSVGTPKYDKKHVWCEQSYLYMRLERVIETLPRVQARLNCLF